MQLANATDDVELMTEETTLSLVLSQQHNSPGYLSNCLRLELLKQLELTLLDLVWFAAELGFPEDFSTTVFIVFYTSTLEFGNPQHHLVE